MAFLGTLDNLHPVTRGRRGARNIRSMVVFSDGAVICRTGIDGGFQPFGALGAMLQTGLQRGLRHRRETSLGDAASALGDAGTAQAFAQTRRKANAIMASDITRVEIIAGEHPVLAIYAHNTAKPGEELMYGYAAPGYSVDELRSVVAPLAGARLMLRTA